MSNPMVFFSKHRKLVVISMLIALMALLAMPVGAQSIDTSAFETAIGDGIQAFFNNLPMWLGIGFGVFAIIFALAGGFAFAQRFLQKILDVFMKV